MAVALSLTLGQAKDPLAVPPGHPPVRGNKEAPSGRELLRQLDGSLGQSNRDKTFEIASSIAKLYALHGRYPEAIRYFREAIDKTAPVRALYLKERRRAAAVAPTSCLLSAESQVEGAVAEAVARAKKGDLPNAVACAREALGPALETQGWMGNAQFLGGDAAAALATYDDVLKVDPHDPTALYGRAGVHFDQGEREQAIADLKVFLSRYASSPRGPQAQALLAKAEGRPEPRTAPPQLTPQIINAVTSTPRTPEFNSDLLRRVDEAEHALAQKKFQDALDLYKQVMPYEPGNGRFRAGMAWALVGLNRQPMADRIWGVAVSSDPSAVEQLGDLLLKQGDAEGAKALYAKLAETSPDYASQVGLSKKLGR